ncbi:MAG: VCBS repeat-containing protein, partial [Myxococcota bacterium]
MRSPACGGLAVAVALGGACVDRRAGDLGGSGNDGGSGLDAGPWTDSGDSAGDTDAQCEDPPATLAEGALGEWGFGYVEHAAITGEWFDLADFDGDGTVDVFAGSADGARVYLQQCDGRFTLGPAIVFAERTTGSVSADFDGDGDIDLAALTTSQTPRFVANDGSGGFQDVGPTADFAAGVALPVALDLGADGTTELFIGGGHSEPGRILRLQADTSFAIVGMIPHPACYFTNAAAGDLDGDGRDDLVATGSCNAPREHFPLRTYRNDGA